MEQLCFEGNVARRFSRHKEFRPLGQPVEVILDQWLQRFCQGWIDAEFTAWIGARRYERTATRRTRRHSAYPRTLVTSRGLVQCRVPRGRVGRYVCSLFARYRRSTTAFEAAVVESVLAGHSTRRARGFFHRLFGHDVVSQQTASRLLQRFDTELACWRQQALPPSVVLLVLDAVHLRGADATRHARPVLVALGVHADGRQELLAFQVARSESQTAWERFTQTLRNRGLTQAALIVHDDCAAISAAVALTWPESREQWCVFHGLRALSQALRGHPQRRALVRDARWLYQAQSPVEFTRWSRQFQQRWQRLRIPAVDRFMAQWPATTQYFALPRAWWAAAKTSNLLERWFEELRRRLRVFRRPPNPRSCERWVYALLASFNHTAHRVPGWSDESHHNA